MNMSFAIKLIRFGSNKYYFLTLLKHMICISLLQSDKKAVFAGHKFLFSQKYSYDIF